MLLILFIASLYSLEIPKCPEPELNHGTSLKVRINPVLLCVRPFSVQLAVKMAAVAQPRVIKDIDMLAAPSS